jgi:ADP-ribosylglycohydrolase
MSMMHFSCPVAVCVIAVACTVIHVVSLGVGCFNVASGQITDDGELALCLAHGLVSGQGAFDIEAVCIPFSFPK